MKKLLMFSACIVMIISTASCQKKEYKELGDGIFADIQTNKGNMIVKLFYKETPITAANFISLAEGTNPKVEEKFKGKPFYDGLTFHRVMQNFMIQGGDPLGNGMGNPGYKFEDEFVDSLKLDHKGVLAMANSGPATNGSQFFITQQETPWLTGRHTVFGELVKGAEVLDSIAAVKTSGGQESRPLSPITINKVIIVKNGSDAKKFDAAKVFNNHFVEKERKEKEAKEKMEAAKKAFMKEIEPQKAAATTTESGLQIYYLNKSDGVQPALGSQVFVKYAGYLASDGTLFATNIKEIDQKFGIFDPQMELYGKYNNSPWPYETNANLIPGFKEALLQMKVGDKVRMFVPSFLGYGPRGGANGMIPPNADLIFDLEITGIAE